VWTRNFVAAAGIKRKFSNFNTSCWEMWRRHFSNKAIAEEWVRDHLRSTFWTKRSSVEEWDSKVADMEEQYESAKPHTAGAMDYAKKSQDHTERLGWVKDHGEMFEISPQYEITWGSAVCYAEIKSEEFMAVAWIAHDKAYLAKASLLKIKHKAQWVKEKKEFDDEMSERVKNETPERNVMFSD